MTTKKITQTDGLGGDALFGLSLVRLKNRLKIKRLTRHINAEVRENFGYSPNYGSFHEALTERIRLLDWSRHNDSEWCDLFDDFERKDRGHLTPSF